MRRLGKILLVLVAIVFVGGAVFLVPTIWFKPWAIDHFYSRVFLRFALRHPMVLSQLRILEPMGIEFHSDDLDDLSMAFRRKEARFVDHELATLRSYDRNRMTQRARVSADVLDWFLEDQKNNEPFLFHDYPVNPMWGVQNVLPEFMTHTHELKKEKDAEYYIARVSKFGVAFDQTIEGMKWRDSKGILPPKFILARVLTETRPFESLPAKENALYQNFDTKLRAMKGLDPVRRDSLCAWLAREIDRTVRPAYHRLNTVLAEEETRATDDAGVWKLPNGDAYYAQCLRSNTTTDLSPDSIHALGEREVTRIEGEMSAILGSQGLPSKQPGAELARLAADPRYRYPAGDSSRARILADYGTILADAERRSQALFDLQPKSKLEIQRVPAFREKGSAAAYYDAPSFDDVRPGTFFANLRDPASTVRFDMRTLAYHEGIPGHHFQISIAMERKDLPFFRRIVPFTAYQEGWALYAEHLAYENGFESDPMDRLGALRAELMRAVRLVVDTGIHRKRWSRERAIDYMVTTTGMDTAEVTSEVERYIVLPGQACAYKVGELAIIAMRERARQRLGDKFDLREFHNVVLSDGAVPLSILEKLVDDWVEAKLKAEKA